MASSEAAWDAAAEGLDALGLLELAARIEARFGDIEVGPAVRGLNARSALNDLPSAELGLQPELLGARPPDYFAIAEIARLAGERRHVLFTGSTLNAEPSDGRVEVSLGAMPEMRERASRVFAAWMVSPPEIVHGMMRSVGMPESQLNIAGLNQLPFECFEVIAPVRGLQSATRAALDDVYFLPPDAATAALGRLGAEEPIASDFAAADCHAVTFITATRMFDAESEGLARIDVALSWLGVQGRYGRALWPDGNARSYNRTTSRSALARQDLVWVRGLMSARQWIRSPVLIVRAGSMDLEARHAAIAGQLRLLSVQERQAASALGRVGPTSEPLQSITALWEALEFYLATVEVPALFSPSQLRALRKAVPADLPQPLRARAVEAINRLNEPSLMRRLRTASEFDGVILSDGEWKLLSRLRRARNQAVHGASQQLPTDTEIDLGVSIVARLLLHRAYRRRTQLAHEVDVGG